MHNLWRCVFQSQETLAVRIHSTHHGLLGSEWRHGPRRACLVYNASLICALASREMPIIIVRLLLLCFRT